MNEKDRDVVVAMQKAVEELDRTQVQMESVSRTMCILYLTQFVDRAIVASTFFSGIQSEKQRMTYF